MSRACFSLRAPRTDAENVSPLVALPGSHCADRIAVVTAQSTSDHSIAGPARSSRSFVLRDPRDAQSGHPQSTPPERRPRTTSIRTEGKGTRVCVRQV
jgi:hypothetical protein